MPTPPKPTGLKVLEGNPGKRRLNMTQRGVGSRRPRNAPTADFLERREQLITAAAEVFHDRGYDAGTLEDVARALAVRRATVYHYVESKGDLLHLVCSRALDMEFRGVRANVPVDDPSARLRALIGHQVAVVTGQPALFRVFFEQRHHLTPDDDQEIRFREREYFAIFATAVRAAQDAEVFPRIDPEIATRSILGMTNWCYAWFVAGRDDADGVTADIVALLLGSDDKRT